MGVLLASSRVGCWSRMNGQAQRGVPEVMLEATREVIILRAKLPDGVWGQSGFCFVWFGLATAYSVQDLSSPTRN